MIPKASHESHQNYGLSSNNTKMKEQEHKNHLGFNIPEISGN